MPRLLVAMLGLGLALGACTESFEQGQDGPIWTEAGPVWPEASTSNPCTTGADSDHDGVPDVVEGCESQRDSDSDGTPDFMDSDSDDDGIKDGNEDLNGDGKLGCCLTTCNEQRKGCQPKADGCGAGQKCEGGKCTPPVHFLCSDGETDPAKGTTFPGGKPDKDLPTFVCHPPGETSNKGLKPMLFKSSGTGNWKVALETTSTYGEIAIDGAAAMEAGASFDLTDKKQEVAGFIVSMPAPAGDVVQIVTGLINKLNNLPGKASVTQLSSGTPKESHDGFDTVVMTQLAVKMSKATVPAAVRNAIFGTLLGKSVSKLPPDSWGTAATDHTLRFQTLLRKDKRVLVMGAVATTANVTNPKVDTGIHLDDLSNGTGLAKASDTDTVECDPFILSGTPVADIIWVVDESGSMNNNRDDVAANAKDFFARAVKSGLDFRMAVTGVCNPSGTYCKGVIGKFCSVVSPDNKHNGGTDRFLLPSEQHLFEGCVKNPPGYEGGSEHGLVNAREAVKKHLPRKANDPTKVRPGAALVVIIATDEGPQTLKTKLSSTWYSYYKQCQLPANIQSQVNAFVKQDLDIYTGKITPEAQAIVHMIGGVCNNKCNAEIGHGYNEIVKATAGITADVCQANLGTTLQIIIDTITGQASPAKLEYVPISASLAVAVDTTQLERSRTKGFDYASSSNTLVFIGVPFPKGSKVVASYRRFKDQGPIID